MFEETALWTEWVWLKGKQKAKWYFLFGKLFFRLLTTDGKQVTCLPLLFLFSSLAILYSTLVVSATSHFQISLSILLCL